MGLRGLSSTPKQAPKTLYPTPSPNRGGRGGTVRALLQIFPWQRQGPARGQPRNRSFAQSSGAVQLRVGVEGLGVGRGRVREISLSPF